ncbi:MAG TPA: pyridoxamine 5'-phosphate oxidase [Gemmatimonadaceae bacterium]|nr:pyridoxamine 5'-phosphate oxidase [Gemmatimonadaceae bacterium]
MATVRPLQDPIELFKAQLAEAQGLPREQLPEPTAFALGTVGDDQQPSIRMLLLKDVDAEGFVFYTNLESRKAGELAKNRRAAMTFHWAPIERQVRIEGRVSPVTPEEADAYFATRPRGSQIGAWASRQSRPMSHMDDLNARVAEYERKFAGQDVPRPPHWSGFRLLPHAIEFWTGKPNRLHERRLFSREGAGWTIQLLYP